MPRSTRTALVGALIGGLALYGCGQRPAADVPPPPPALAYGVPALSPATFTVADTASFTIDAGAMGEMNVTAAYSGLAEMTVAAGGDGFRAVIAFPRFDGSFRTDADGTQYVDATDIAGTFIMNVGPRGPVAMEQQPELSQELLDVVGAESLVRPLFVQLPDRAVVAGDVWVDTVTSVDESAESRTEATTILITTLVGDTLVGDRPLLLLRTRAENRIEMHGVSGGTRVHQLLTGATDGTVIWDDQLELLVQRQEHGHLTGTLALPATDVNGMPITARVRRSVTWIGAPTPDPEDIAAPGGQ